MADTKISLMTDGVTAAGTDRIPVARDPTGTPLSRYITPAYVKDYILGLANTWAATQTITPAANTSALIASGFSLTGANAQSLIDLAGTWNTSGTPTAFKLNITDTASNSASLLADLQVGGGSIFSVYKSGKIELRGVCQFSVVNNALQINSGNTNDLRDIIARTINGNTLKLGSGVTPDVNLERDAANVFAQRNGVNAQTFRVYSTFTDSSNYERGALNAGSDYIELAAETAGTGDDNLDVRLTPAGNGRIDFRNSDDAAAAQVGTLTNAPTAGNPTFWVTMKVNGTALAIPAWALP